MEPTPAKIVAFDLYRANGRATPPYINMKVQLHTGLLPGGSPVDNITVDTILRLDPSKDTIASLNKQAAARIHAAIQKAATMSVADVERAIEHSLEYDENR